MIKLTNEDEIYTMIRAGLLDTIRTHGVIHRHLVRSATKRVLGAIKNHIYNQQVKKIKKIKKIRETPFSNA